MNTRWKITGLAALPLAGLLATGGVALAQGPGPVAGTQVVQQAATHQAGGIPGPRHAVNTATPQPCDRQQVQDRDRDGSCGDHQVQAVQAAARTMEHARDGSCAGDVDG